MLQQTLTVPKFGIVPPQDFYTVKGVLLPSGAYSDVQVTSQLLDGGRYRTQAGWAEHRKHTGWGPGSGPLNFAVDSTLYDKAKEIDLALSEGNGDAEQLRVLLGNIEMLRVLRADDFRKHLMMTGTRVTYRPGSKLDLVTHDAGTPEQRTLEARLVGPNGYINEGMSGEMQALLGSPDVRKVSDVYKWVTGRESYLWRFNKAPKTDKGRALVLGNGNFNDVDFYFNANVDIGYGRPARGVRIAPPDSTGSMG